MPETTVNLGDHSVKLQEHTVLITGHSGLTDPTELVLLNNDEAYLLYVTLHAHFAVQYLQPAREETPAWPCFLR